MKRIIIISFITLIVLITGLVIFIHMNRDKITASIATIIEKTTGQPLKTETIPQLSFFPVPGIVLGKSTWGNPKTDKISVSVEQCSFKISLFQLITGTIAIKEILLNEPVITIKDKPKTPSKNLEAQQSSTKEKNFSLPSITMDSLIIKNGTITLYSGNKQFILKELNMSANNIKPQHLSTIKISSLVSLQPENIELSINSKTSIVLDTDSITLKSFDFQVTPNKGLPFVAPITVAGSANYIFDKNLLKDLDIQTNLKNFIATLKGSLNLNTISGTIDITANGSLRKLAQEFGFVIVTPDRHALDKVSITTTSTLKNKSVQLKNISIDFDDSKITGDLNIDLQKLGGALAITTIDFDRYLPISIAENNPISKVIQNIPNNTPTRAPTQTHKSTFPDIDITLTARAITIAKLHIQNLNSQLIGNASEYNLNPCTFLFYDGQISINGTIKNLGSQPLYSGQITTTNINLPALIHDINMSKTAVLEQGIISLSANLYASGTNIQQIKRTLSGNAQINGGNIVVHFEAIPKAVSELTNLGRQVFTNLNGQIQATDGTLTINKFILVGKPSSASAKGIIVLPNNYIKIHANIGIDDTIIPINISGNLLDPSYGVDPIRIIQGAVESILNNSENSILNMVLPKNTQKNIHNAAEKMFNKIFGN